MTKPVIKAMAATLMLAATLNHLAAAETSPDLKSLQGKWSVTKTNREGQPYSQVIEIKNDKLTFQLLGDDGRPRFIAKATVKAEKAGPFDALTIFDIQAGGSENDLNAVNDRRTSIYVLRDGKLILASNFDKERENEKPTVDAYARLETRNETAEAGGDGESKLLGNWKLDLTYGDNHLDYDLRIRKADGKLEATLISPRSGEHKCKSATYKDNQLVLEADREIDGNQVVFVYKAKLTGDGLTGTFAVKGQEDQFSGQFKARK